MSESGKSETLLVEVQAQCPEIIQHDTWELGALQVNYSGWLRMAALVERAGTDEEQREFRVSVLNARELRARNLHEDRRHIELMALVAPGGES